MVLRNLQEHWWCATDDDGVDVPLTKVNQLNVLGESPIHIAAWKGTAQDVQWLLDNGADIHQRGEFGMTPLHYAYMGYKLENVEALLNAGADETLKDDHGLRPAQGRTG